LSTSAARRTVTSNFFFISTSTLFHADPLSVTPLFEHYGRSLNACN
jgi:hypothetical protein